MLYLYRCSGLLGGSNIRQGSDGGGVFNRAVGLSRVPNFVLSSLLCRKGCKAQGFRVAEGIINGGGCLSSDGRKFGRIRA